MSKFLTKRQFTSAFASGLLLLLLTPAAHSKLFNLSCRSALSLKTEALNILLPYRMAEKPMVKESPMLQKARSFNERFRAWVDSGNPPLDCPIPERFEIVEKLRADLRAHLPSLEAQLFLMKKNTSFPLRLEALELIFKKGAKLLAKLDAETVDTITYGRLSHYISLATNVLSIRAEDFASREMNFDKFTLEDIEGQKQTHGKDGHLWMVDHWQDNTNRLNPAGDYSSHIVRFPAIGMVAPFTFLRGLENLISFETVFFGDTTKVDRNHHARTARVSKHDREHIYSVSRVFEGASPEYLAEALAFVREANSFVNFAKPLAFSRVTREQLFHGMVIVMFNYYHEIGLVIHPLSFLEHVQRIRKSIREGYHSRSLYPYSYNNGDHIESVLGSDPQYPLLQSLKALERFTQSYIEQAGLLN